MASTYTPIATTTLGADAANIDFTSISGTYTDIILVITGNSTNANAGSLYVRVNGDSGTNYSNTQVYGDGTTAASTRNSNTNNANGLGITGTSQSPSVGIAHFMNYANTTTYKTFLFRNNMYNAEASASAALWRSTSAINRITLSHPSSNIKAGTTATLYGIKAA